MRDDDPGDEVTGWEIVGGADWFQFSVARDTGELRKVPMLLYLSIVSTNSIGSSSFSVSCSTATPVVSNLLCLHVLLLS